MKILDSDHCVAILRRKLNVLDHLQPGEDIGITSISVGELIHGVYKSNRIQENLERLDVMLSGAVILPYDETAARCFGYIKARLERTGEIIGELDMQIASIAITTGSPLLTHNSEHFSRLTWAGLTLEDWL